jgi:WD40 repeat protein
MTESRTEFKLKTPPEDGISSVKFGPNSSQFLLVSSWDSTVRLYDVITNNMRLKYTHDRPVLDICFQVKYFIRKDKVYMVSSCLSPPPINFEPVDGIGGYLVCTLCV